MSESQQPTTKSNTRNVRYIVHNVPWFVRIQDINAMAAEHNLEAHFVKGRALPRGARTAFIISKSEEQNKQAQQLLAKWLNENFERLRARTVNDKKAQKVPKEGSEDATESQAPNGAGTDPTSSEPSSSDEKSKIHVPLKFRYLPPRPRKSANSGESEAPATNGTVKTEEAKPESEADAKADANADAKADAKTEKEAKDNTESKSKPASRTRSKRTKTRKSSSTTDSKSGAESAPESAPETVSGTAPAVDAASDATSSEAKTPEAGPSGTAGKGKNGRNGRRGGPTRKPRAPTVKVPRDDAVYVRVPGPTTTDEIRELLPGFTNVAIKLNHRVGFRRKSTLNSAEAIITVGAENQKKALDALAGKDVRGKILEPFPSYTHVRVESSGTQEAQQPALEQTSVEHVE